MRAKDLIFCMVIALGLSIPTSSWAAEGLSMPTSSKVAKIVTVDNFVRAESDMTFKRYEHAGR